ncbi:MAG: DNA replication and repair protein RecF, partial [Endozoicomonadaceae bacterium]|nr:DNA replication and repair protein RecF [Endozoicomonadaceae bacterium]
TAGPQRADLKITYQGRLASDILSRGQQKILVCALKVAQGKLFEKTHKQRCVFLVDDLPAELDPEHCEQFINMINPLFSQFWLTAINTEQLQPFFSKKTIKMFHVEHGAINN